MNLTKKAEPHYLFTNRDIVKIVTPVIIEQFLSFLVGMADSMMIARVGEEAVSAVSLVDQINVLVIFLFSAMATGGTVVAGIYLGQKKEEKAQSVTNQLIITISLIAVVIAALLFIFKRGLLTLIFGAVDPRVMDFSVRYMAITTLSIPFIAVYNGGASIFRAMSDTRTPMLASLLMNIINIVGNAICIFILNMEVEGVAIPTLVSRVFSAVFICVLLTNEKNILHFTKPFSFKLEWKIVSKIFGIGIPNGVENAMFQFGKLIIVSMITAFGTAHITANAVCNSISVFMIIPGSGMGITAVTVISRCYGAGDPKQIKFYTMKLLKLAVIGNAIICGIVILLLPTLIGLYNLSDETAALTRWIIYFVSIIDIFVWPVSFMLPNAFRATGDVKFTMIIAVASMWIFRVGGSYVFGVLLGMGVKGVQIGLAFDWVFRSVCFVWRYNSKKWNTRISSKALE